MKNNNPSCPAFVFRLPAAVALAGGLVLALAGCGKGGAAGKALPAGTGRPVAVGVQIVQPQSVALTTVLPGRTSSPLVAEIRPQVGGIVQARRFTEGAHVRAGQVLYQIDPATYQAALASAQASVAKAEATVQTNRLTAQRQAELLKIDAVSQQAVQDARAALAQAEADLAAARASRQTAQLNLQRTSLTSPIAGIADVSSVTPGALVTADQATALTTVRQIDPIQVDITQSSADLLRLQRELASGRVKGVNAETAPVRLLLEDGSTYARTGSLRFRGVSVNASTGAVTLRALFSNPDGLLLPGMYVRAVLQTAAASQALVVPQQALTRDARGAASVLVVDAQNKVQRRSVNADQAVDNGWLVAAGLLAGERVIVEGQGKIKPGDTVQAEVVTLPAATGAASAAAASTASAAAR